jgi:hypothetical protein
MDVDEAVELEQGVRYTASNRASKTEFFYRALGYTDHDLHSKVHRNWLSLSRS